MAARQVNTLLAGCSTHLLRRNPVYRSLSIFLTSAGALSYSPASPDHRTSREPRS